MVIVLLPLSTFILRVSAYAEPLILRLILRLILLTRIFLCRGAEEDAESGLEVGRLAGGVSPAELDAVGEHEGARSRVQHVVGGRVDIARDELEVRVLLQSIQVTRLSLIAIVVM